MEKDSLRNAFWAICFGLLLTCGIQSCTSNSTYSQDRKLDTLISGQKEILAFIQHNRALQQRVYVSDKQKMDAQIQRSSNSVRKYSLIVMVIICVSLNAIAWWDVRSQIKLLKEQIDDRFRSKGT